MIEINKKQIVFLQSKKLLTLNNDTEVISKEWLSAMLEHAQREEIGAIGAKLIYSNNTIQHAGLVIGIVDNPPVAGHLHRHFPKNDLCLNIRDKGYLIFIPHMQNYIVTNH